ncbi:GNAT family N-acetyltransferase [Streptacidiphilus sp. EB129]|uniref:GNAT family N-acetyltransferase n=1 Tax=Streptacidiphilus sp. EB129 TaxID=3156262 RepID=UPI003519CEC7
MTPPSVGAAGGADVAAILAVLDGAYWPFAARFRPTALRENADSVAAELATWLVAREADQVTGCVKHYPDGDWYTLCFLATRAESRRRGHAGALLDEVAVRARSAGHRTVRIALRRSLTGNVDFFVRHGYRYLEPFPTGEHDLYQLSMGA